MCAVLTVTQVVLPLQRVQGNSYVEELQAQGWCSVLRDALRTIARLCFAVCGQWLTSRVQPTESATAVADDVTTRHAVNAPQKKAEGLATVYKGDSKTRKEAGNFDTSFVLLPSFLNESRPFSHAISAPASSGVYESGGYAEEEAAGGYAEEAAGGYAEVRRNAFALFPSHHLVAGGRLRRGGWLLRGGR